MQYERTKTDATHGTYGVGHLHDSQRVFPSDFFRQRSHISLIGPISPIRRRSLVLEDSTYVLTPWPCRPGPLLFLKGAVNQPAFQ
jgi:hypothetical protein